MKNIGKIVMFMGVVVAIIIYAIVRIVFTVILARDYSTAEVVFSVLLLIAELFILIHAMGYAINLIRAKTSVYAHDNFPRHLPDTLPDVAVLVAARHEPREVLEDTFRAITNLRYPAKKIYFLDDSSDERYIREADEIASKFGLELFRRKKRHGAKAGIVNDCLKSLKEKYVAIFDADMNPLPGFIEQLVPIMEADSKLAFIQTPQFYSNIERNRVAEAACYQQAVFYEYICEAKGSNQSMFCCGTNVIFRRKALLEVGGFDETVVTEDIATSLKLHASGWKSLYYNHVGTFGMGPESLAAYFKQQLRWSRGTVGTFRKVLWRFIRNPFQMSIWQWWEYFLSTTYYFVGLAFLILMICPVTYILFNIPSFFIHADIYLSVFVPYFMLSLGVFYVTMRSHGYKAKKLLKGQMLIYIASPVLVVSTILGLLGIQGSFGITMKGSEKRMPYPYLWPQLSLIVMNFAVLVWGINRFYYERDFSVIVNCFWIAYHFIMVSALFYFNEDSPKGKAA